MSKKRKEWSDKNREKINATAKAWRDRNPDKTKELWDNHMYDGNKQAALERDNFQCQDCGMTQEQHIILFSRRLEIHHIDGMGYRVPKEFRNNDLNNLITLCLRCHKRLHVNITTEKKWGNLLEQDDSEYRYPKIRDMVDSKVEELGGVQKAKRAVAKNLKVSFWTIDTKYYERKKCVIRGKHDE